MPHRLHSHFLLGNVFDLIQMICNKTRFLRQWSIFEPVLQCKKQNKKKTTSGVKPSTCSLTVMSAASPLLKMFLERARGSVNGPLLARIAIPIFTTKYNNNTMELNEAMGTVVHNCSIQKYEQINSTTVYICQIATLCFLGHSEEVVVQQNLKCMELTKISIC